MTPKRRGLPSDRRSPAAYNAVRLQPADPLPRPSRSPPASCRRMRPSDRRAPSARIGRKMYLEKFRLDRKTAVVTGAGQGIGLACAEALAEAGAKVVIADRDPKAAETGCALLTAKGYDAELVNMDVTDSARVSEVA